MCTCHNRCAAWPQPPKTRNTKGVAQWCTMEITKIRKNGQSVTHCGVKKTFCFAKAAPVSASATGSYEINLCALRKQRFDKITR